MSTNLSADLREAFRRLQALLPESERQVISRVRVSAARKGEARYQALVEIVLCYRDGPRSLWAPVLLDLLAPSILARLQRLRPQAPLLDPEDLRQELIVELLQAAASMPLPKDRRYLRSRLMARANQGVWRRLAREGRRQRDQRSLNLLDREAT